MASRGGSADERRQRGGRGREDHSQWSTIRPGPVRGGLELEVDDDAGAADAGGGAAEGRTAAGVDETADDARTPSSSSAAAPSEGFTEGRIEGIGNAYSDGGGAREEASSAYDARYASSVAAPHPDGLVANRVAARISSVGNVYRDDDTHPHAGLLGTVGTREGGATSRIPPVGPGIAAGRPESPRLTMVGIGDECGDGVGGGFDFDGCADENDDHNNEDDAVRASADLFGSRGPFRERRGGGCGGPLPDFLAESQALLPSSLSGCVSVSPAAAAGIVASPSSPSASSYSSEEGGFPSFWAPAGTRHSEEEKKADEVIVGGSSSARREDASDFAPGPAAGSGKGKGSSSSSAIPESFWDDEDGGGGCRTRGASRRAVAPNLMDRVEQSRSFENGRSLDTNTAAPLASHRHGSHHLGGGAASSKFSSSSSSSSSDLWNPLNVSLSLAFALITAAAAAPVTLIPAMAKDILRAASYDDALAAANGDVDLAAEYLASEASSFASRAASHAVLGAALGKFVNGPAGDLFGAGRVARLYAGLLAGALVALSMARSERGALWCCAAVEFFVSVQWPCVAVILAAHYRDSDGGGAASSSSSSFVGANARGSSAAAAAGGGVWVDVERHGVDTTRAAGGGGRVGINGGGNLAAGGGGGSSLSSSNAEGRYEAGIYVASLASRVGSLLAIPLSAWTLRSASASADGYGDVDGGEVGGGGGGAWRTVARCGALSSLLGLLVLRTFVTDSPRARHDPQNPVRPSTLASVVQTPLQRARPPWIEVPLYYVRTVHAVLLANVVPSLRSILTSGTFWIVAVAHSGGAMVRSSDRILGTYLADTSSGTLADDRAGGLTVSLSLGILGGLALGGSAFTRLASRPRERKSMVVRLYVLAASMCYALSFLAVPGVRSFINSPGLITMLQVLAACAMGAGVAVQLYILPPIVGATFGTDKGLYAAYTDGVSYGVGSVVWRIVGGAVEEGNPQGAGWAYGWAAVALLVVLCAVLMVEFVEHYFCRGGWRGHVAGRQSSFAPSAAEARKEDDASLGGGRGSSMGAFSLSAAKESMRRRGRSSSAKVPGSPVGLFRRGRRDAAEHQQRDAWLDDNDGEESTVVFEAASAHINFDDDDMGGGGADDEDAKKGPSTPEEDLKCRVLALLDRPENMECADCSDKFPRWASIIAPASPSNESRSRIAFGRPFLAPSARPTVEEEVGCFTCTACAGAHRGLGTNVLRVRSVDHDRWTSEADVTALERGGNMFVNALFEAGLLSDASAMKPRPASDGRARRDFAADKYARRAWRCSSATGAAGPSAAGAGGGAAPAVSLDEIRSSSGVLADLASDDEEDDDDDAREYGEVSNIEMVPSASPLFPRRKDAAAFGSDSGAATEPSAAARAREEEPLDPLSHNRSSGLAAAGGGSSSTASGAGYSETDLLGLSSLPFRQPRPRGGKEAEGGDSLPVEGAEEGRNPFAGGDIFDL